MLIRPDRDDLRIIGYYVGKVLTGLGMLLAIPLAHALVIRQWNDASALAIGLAITVAASRLTELRFRTQANLNWSHGLVAVALSWLLGSAVLAIPLYLSGHVASYLDAYFDALSGLTTSGLSLIQDLDHLSDPMQFLRHLSHFAGGQGIVIVMLTVVASSGAQLQTLYVGEGREDRIVPNVVRTSRFIYRVALAYLAVGVPALVAAGLVAGLSPGRALFHAVNIFMAAFDTGGFAPQSTSIAYYHSALYEAVIVVLMIAGTLSFALHHALWRGRTGTAFRNVELRALATTLLLTAMLAMLGLARSGTYTRPLDLFRKGLFTIVSAHTGTGFTVVAAQDYAFDWSRIAPAIVVVAMALGGMAGSTAGGIKMIRVALASKAILGDIRRVVAPSDAVVVASYHGRVRQVVNDRDIRTAITIIVLFLFLYLAGALVGVFYGIPFERAMFESTSAAANVGLSNGVLAPDLPGPLKLVYIAQMYLGRLEFMAVFALIGYGVAIARGRL